MAMVLQGHFSPQLQTNGLSPTLSSIRLGSAATTAKARARTSASVTETTFFMTSLLCLGVEEQNKQKHVRAVFVFCKEGPAYFRSDQMSPTPANSREKVTEKGGE
jgi:hypothetical protein